MVGSPTEDRRFFFEGQRTGWSVGDTFSPSRQAIV
jgi:hypothetical protein